ncbi:MAG: calcium-binding protein, partial [Planctomycetota bacterium]|nr:calcium-binding protein [Planctomycetota bacterium]
NIDAGLTVNGQFGDDHMTVDDNAVATTLNGGVGDDSFRFGQVYHTRRDAEAGVRPEDVFPTVETTRGFLSSGVSFATTANGGPGEDDFTVWNNLAALQLNGGAGDDWIDGGTQDDAISGWTGDDTLYGRSGNDILVGGDGHDTLYGASGDDILQGDDGKSGTDHTRDNDRLDGGTDSDTVRGGGGSDTMMDDSAEVDENFAYWAEWVDAV